MSFNSIQTTRLTRFKREGGWRLNGLAVERSRFAVSGHTEHGSTTFIEIFDMKPPDTFSQKPSWEKDFPFEPGSRWRYVSFIDSDPSLIFAVRGKHLELYNTDTGEKVLTNQESSLQIPQCVTIRDKQIYICFHMMSIVNIYDMNLTGSSRVDLKKMEDGDWPIDIAVKHPHLFISTDKGRALMFFNDGSLQHGYEPPYKGSLACSVTVNSDTVFVLWKCIHLVHPVVVVAGYSVSTYETLFNFVVDVEIISSAIIRAYDSNRIMIATEQGYLSVYSTVSRA